MATGSRTLTLKLLADIDNFTKNTNLAEAQAQGLGGKIEKFGAAAKAAFAAAAAAAAAYAVKLGVDGVKAAIEDEQAQASLARTLQAATGATNQQIAATEKYIGKMQLATGVADTDLRKALARLALSTNDVTKSQELLSLALDISKATGKDLDGVANALGKAYDGQTTALGKLGIGLSSAELKTMQFKDVQTRLSDLFGGAASANAKTFQGQIDIMKQRFAEFQENIGYKLLPILLQLFTFLNNNLSPAFEWLKKNAIDPVADAINRNKDTFIGYWNFIKDNFLPLIGGALMLGLQGLGKAASFVVDAVGVAIRALQPLLNLAIDGINLVIRGINLVKSGSDIPTVSKLNTSGSGSSSSNPNLKTTTTSTSIATIPKVSTSMNVPSISTSGVSSAVSSAGGATQDLYGNQLNPVSGAQVSGAVTNPNVLAAYKDIFNANGSPIVVNVSGAIDPESTARTIVNTLNNSFYRGTGGAGGLVTA